MVLPLVREGLTDGLDRMNTRFAIFLLSLSLFFLKYLVGYVGGLNNYYEIIYFLFPWSERRVVNY